MSDYYVLVLVAFRVCTKVLVYKRLQGVIHFPMGLYDLFKLKYDKMSQNNRVSSHKQKKHVKNRRRM